MPILIVIWSPLCGQNLRWHLDRIDRIIVTMIFTATVFLLGASALQAPLAARPAVGFRATTQAPVRSSDVVMGATIRELRDRVGSVKNTKKITSAMKLVAAAKVRRAQEAVLRSRPFSETLERILGGLLQRLKTEALDIPLLEARPAQKVGLVSITGDRGLCGAYNSAAIKKTEARIAELKEQGVACELILIGNKGSTYFKKRETPVRKMIPCGQAPTAAQAQEVADELLSSYYAGEIDRVELLYTTFISMIASSPTVRTLVPLLPSGLEMEGDEIFKLTSKDGDIAVEKETVAVADRPSARASHPAAVTAGNVAITHPVVAACRPTVQLERSTGRSEK